MSTYTKYNISNDESGIRIDRWLRRKFPNLPQSFFEKKLRKGFIRLNKKVVKANKKIKFCDLIEIHDYDNQKYILKGISRNINISKKLIKKFNSSIIFQNEDYIVINKWKGIATQGGSNIINSIDGIIKGLSGKMNLVHRLDKETSGILLISKNYKTSRFFGSLFKNKKINKIYLAICNKRPSKKKGIIKLKIEKFKDIKKDKINYSLTKQDSITNYEVLDNKDNVSSILFFPLTGKRHQIRIVAKYLGCPILGDSKYGYKNKINYKNNKKTKLMLHAFGISFDLKNIKQKYYAQLDKEMINNFKKFGLKIPKNDDIKKYL